MEDDVDKYLAFLEQSAQWHRRHANKAMVLFITLRLMLTILSASLPAIVAVDLGGIDPTIPAVTIAVLAALDTQFKWGDEWRQYRTTQLSLERLVRMYRNGAFASASVDPKRFHKLVEEAETLMARDAESFFLFRISEWKVPR